MDTILYHVYRALSNTMSRWELMASIYIPVALNLMN